jgi:hypothetical protein
VTIYASERLRISPHTVNTHRKSIMAKLSLHHKGELFIHALKQGYVWVTPEGNFYPGSSGGFRAQQATRDRLRARMVQFSWARCCRLGELIFDASNRPAPRTLV